MAAIIFSATGSLSDAAFDATLSVIEFDATLSETHSSKSEKTSHPVEAGVAISDHVRPSEDRVTLEVIVTNTPLNDMSVSRFLAPTGRLQSAAPLRMANLPLTLSGVTVAGEQRLVGKSKQVATPKIKAARQPGFGFPMQLRGALNADARDNPPEVTPGRFDKLVPNGVSGSPLQAVTPANRVKLVYEVLQSLVRSGVEVNLVTDLRDYPSMVITSLSTPKTAMDALVFSMELEEIRFSSTKKTEVKALRVEEPRAEKKVDQGPTAPAYFSAEAQAHKQSVLDGISLGGTEAVVN